MTTRVVDALGTWCPVPIHLIDRVARRAAPGDRIALLADDPLIAVDLPAWCHRSGNELLELRRDGEAWVGVVAVGRAADRRGGGPPRGHGTGRSAGG